MAREVRAVVAPAKGALVRGETVRAPTPGPGEALVRVQTCGVCHTDLHYREGGVGEDFPVLVDLYRQGRLALAAFVSETVVLDQVEAAFDRRRAGDVLRSVVVL